MEIKDLKLELIDKSVSITGLSDEDIIREAIANGIIDASHDLAKSLGSGAKKVGNTYEDFLKAREAGSMKVQNKAGDGGVNPYQYDEEVFLCQVTGISEQRKSAAGGTYYRTKLVHKQHGAVNVNSDGPLEEGAYYHVVARLLPPGVYMDANKAGVRRELHVPAGRHLIYNPKYGPLKVTLQGLQIENALSGNLAGF